MATGTKQRNADFAVSFTIFDKSASNIGAAKIAIVKIVIVKIAAVKTKVSARPVPDVPEGQTFCLRYDLSFPHWMKFFDRIRLSDAP